MRNQTKSPAPKNAPFAILTVGGGVQAIIMDKDGKNQIADVQAVKLDEIADFADAVKNETPAYTIIRYEHELATLARLTGYDLDFESDRFLAYQHAEKHGYKFLANAIVFTFMDTAPIFEVRGKDGNRRYYQMGKRIPAHLFDCHCVSDSIQYIEITKQTKQAYAQPYKGDKKQVNKSTLASMANVVLTTGYCQLQTLLRTLSPSAYYANINGWQADGYLITPNLAISTGYSIVGTHKIPPHLALIAERKAMAANTNLNQSHDEHMGKLSAIMTDLITDTLAYHQCHFG